MPVDPVRYGLVASLNRLDSNITGISFDTTELTSKRFDLLLEIAPLGKTIGYLSGGPRFMIYDEETTQLKMAAELRDRELVLLDATNDAEIEKAFAEASERRVAALLVSNNPALARSQLKIATLARHYKIPAIYSGPGWVSSGGLMSYSPDLQRVVRQIATEYVARILAGAKPSSLPVQRSTRYRFIVNSKTMNELGIALPDSLRPLAELVE
jgi:putative ABC transport system substrate-binding protein